MRSRRAFVVAPAFVVWAIIAMLHLLEALECPFAGALPEPHKLRLKEQVLLVSWLEDRVIRDMDISERDSIRPTNAQAEHNIDGYLKRLGCPFDFNPTESADNMDALHWAIGHGVGLKFEDENAEMEAEDAMGQGENNAEISAKINEIGTRIGLARGSGESNTDYVRRMADRIKQCLVVNDQNSTGFTLADFPLGFDTGDQVVNDVSKVLKLLYVSDFRDLQDDVNDLLVLCQEYTANPRLNASLGRVGR